MKLCSHFSLLLSGEASGFFHLFHTATKVVKNTIRKAIWFSNVLISETEQASRQVYCAAFHYVKATTDYHISPMKKWNGLECSLLRDLGDQHHPLFLREFPYLMPYFLQLKSMKELL